MAFRKFQLVQHVQWKKWTGTRSRCGKEIFFWLPLSNGVWRWSSLFLTIIKAEKKRLSTRKDRNSTIIQRWFHDVHFKSQKGDETFIMRRLAMLIFLIVHLTTIESVCVQPVKYYIDCNNTRTLSQAMALCLRYGMTLVNVSNSSSLFVDIALLNSTLTASNCYANFWFSSGNTTGYVGNVASLGEVLTGVLSGVLGGVGQLLGSVVDLLACLLGGCPATTTPAPISQAFTVCTRQLQQRVIQKCLAQPVRADMKTFQFTEQPMFGAILDRFAARSRALCSSFCSSDPICVGISFEDSNSTCTLHM